MESRRYEAQLTFALVYIVLTLVILLSAIWLGLLIANRLVQPISALINATQKLGDGDLSARVRDGHRTDDEVGQLARTFNTMAERISDQQPGQVFTGLSGLDDLPLARASVRQEFLRRGRRWRDQLQEETERLRDQFQQVSGQMEERLEGWLEEDAEELQEPRWQRNEQDAWDDWEDTPAPRSPRERPAPQRDDDPWF